ncbi:MAG: adenosylcobinamide-phosphate synthase CbiB [Lachnospiraceae bacterium]|nr:adenosylcobinamide-phosphate synthase CbiB [Lachnospiraceae bacterium]
MYYHMSALALGLILDLMIGDPHNMPHPIRWIGRLIGFLEKHFNDHNRSGRILRIRGLFIVIIVITLPAIICAAVMIASYRLNMYVGMAIEAVITCYMLACRSLYNESMKVYKTLNDDDIDASRKAVSMIVGRDTESLDKQGITRATVETIAENTSDGVIAPLLYMAIGGPILGLIYKSVNTMDSMIGYKDEKYRDIGFFAAKLDDVLNFLPARLSAVIMIASAAISGRDYSASYAAKIYRRDRYKHASPNSAHCESVCAGALGIRLAGPASYFGKTVDKQYIGDALREIENRDIVRTNRLMILTTMITFIICELLLWLMAVQIV